MLSAIISLLLFAIPLVALPTSPYSLDQRGTSLELEIFMTETALANKTALKDLKFWKTDPGSTYPVAMTIDPSPGYKFGDGLEEATWTAQVIAEKMSVLYLDATSQGATNFSIVRSSGDSMDVSLSSPNHSTTQLIKVVWYHAIPGAGGRQTRLDNRSRCGNVFRRRQTRLPSRARCVGHQLYSSVVQGS
jgi:hypothetical protein